MFGSGTRSSSSGMMPATEGFAAFSSMANPSNSFFAAPVRFGYSSYFGNQTFPTEIQTRPLAHGSNPPSFLNGYRGSRVPAYSPAAELSSQTQPAPTMVSIVSMPAYSNNSHEELRWEDYQLGDKGSTGFGLPTVPSEVTQAQRKGTRIARYASAVMPSEYPCELVSLSSMASYKEKSHEELRWEDYQSGDKGDWTQTQTNESTIFGAPAFSFQNNGIGVFASTSEVEKPNGPPKLVSISSMPAYTRKSHELLRWEDYQFGDKGGPTTELTKAITGLALYYGMGSRLAAYNSTPEVDSHIPQFVENPLIFSSKVPPATQRRNGSSSTPPATLNHSTEAITRVFTSTDEVDGRRRIQPTEELLSTSLFKHSDDDSGRNCHGLERKEDAASGNLTSIDKEGATKSAEPSNGASGSYSPISTQKGDLNISEAAGPKLQRSGYYTLPRIEELDINKQMSNFVVGRHGYGSIKFLGKIDLKNLDLDSLIQFNEGEVIGFTDMTKKTPEGEVSDAEVTLLNINCINKRTGKKYVEGPKVDKYREMLVKKATEQGGEFVSYDPISGEWKFKVRFHL